MGVKDKPFLTMRVKKINLFLTNRRAMVGATPWVIVGVVLIALILFIGVSRGVFANKVITSVNSVSDGCKPKNIPVSIKGTGFTKDVAWLGVITEPDKVNLDSVTAGGVSLRAVTTQDFTWTAKLYDDFTGNLVTQDAGSNSHPGGGVLVEDKFSLNFFVPDNNCDGMIDDFEGNIVYEVRTDDGEAKAVSQKISFRQGRLVR